jgi:hypothetical protein
MASSRVRIRLVLASLIPVGQLGGRISGPRARPRRADDIVTRVPVPIAIRRQPNVRGYDRSSTSRTDENRVARRSCNRVPVGPLGRLDP